MSPSLTPQQRAVETMACCAHHIESCGVAAACTACVAAVLRQVERETWEKAVFVAQTQEVLGGGGLGVLTIGLEPLVDELRRRSAGG